MVTARRKEKEKERRRNDIIDAAEKSFFERGYDNVSMDDVAKAAELAKGTVYLYFKNKESLFFAVALRGARILTDMFEEVLEGGGTGAERLYGTGVSYYRFYKEYPDYYKLFIYSQSPCFGPMSEYTGELQRLGRRSIEIMCQCILEGQKDGSIRPDVDPIKAAFYLIYASEGVINHSARYKTEMESLGISQDEFVEFSLNSMGGGLSNNWRTMK
jgi:TetR/AcrR family transcriptional regulator